MVDMIDHDIVVYKTLSADWRLRRIQPTGSFTLTHSTVHTLPHFSESCRTARSCNRVRPAHVRVYVWAPRLLFF